MSKIINFEQAKEGIDQSFTTETSYSIKPKRGRWECKHNNLLLNASTRLAECQTCGDEIDPFDVLLGYACNERETKQDIARLEAARAEFDAIQKNWSLTIAEKRRINKAVHDARIID